MPNIETRVRKTIEKYGMLVPGDCVVTGLSGGADSVALLHILHGLRNYGLRIIAAHLNHGIRGKEAGRDALFSRGVAESLKIEFEYAEVSAPEYRKKTKLSLEDAARVLRYEFFEEVRKKHRARRVATAHTLDDQAETVLMRLLRGSGRRGLSGIPPVSGKTIIRPLIETGRTDIEAYLRSNGAGWIEDSSNKKRDFLRNRIRLDLIPELGRYNPKIKETLARTSDILRLEEDFIWSEGQRGFRRIFGKDAAGSSGDLKKYRRLHKSIRLTVLRIALGELKQGLKDISSVHVLSADEFLTSDTKSGEAAFPGGIVIAKGYDSFLVTTKEGLGRGYSYSITSPGKWTFRELEVEIEKTSLKTLDREREDVVYLDPGSVKFPIEVRSWRPGDRFIPLGMSKPKKLKSYFIDRKVPKFMRSRIPIFFSGGEIIWIGGMRIDDRAKVPKKAAEALRFRLTRPEPYP